MPVDILALRVSDVSWKRDLKIARAARCVLRSSPWKRVIAMAAMKGRRRRRERWKRSRARIDRPWAGALVAGLERHSARRAQRRGRGSCHSVSGLQRRRGASSLRGTKEGRGEEERAGDSGRGNGAEEELRADKVWEREKGLTAENLKPSK
jgi:hypothetical protein